jgi:DNA-binding MarR family transcriptional regulator
MIITKDGVMLIEIYEKKLHSLTQIAKGMNNKDRSYTLRRIKKLITAGYIEFVVKNEHHPNYGKEYHLTIVGMMLSRQLSEIKKLLIS